MFLLLFKAFLNVFYSLFCNAALAWEIKTLLFLASWRSRGKYKSGIIIIIIIFLHPFGSGEAAPIRELFIIKVIST